METILWVVLGVVLAVAEIFTTTLVLAMLAAGAFAAAVAAGIGAPIGVQALVFALVSALSVVAVRPTIRRHMLPSSDSDAAPIGIEAMQGASALVLERVDADQGVVKIDGEIWTARAYDATQVFAPGERVRVIEVKGVVALVWRDDFSSQALPNELPESKR